jgi:hypothetical protein
VPPKLRKKQKVQSKLPPVDTDDGAAKQEGSDTDDEEEKLDDPLPSPLGFDPSKFLKERKLPGKHHAPTQIRLNAKSVAYAAAPASAVTSTSTSQDSRATKIPSTIKVCPDPATSSSLSTLSKRHDATVGIRLAAASQRAPNAVTSTPLDLSLMAFSDKTIKSIVKTCVKDNIFSQCKFYSRDKHGRYDCSPTSMCGQVMKHCNIVANETWWYQMRPVIVKTHTDHRNNCIKRLNGCFKRKLKYVLCS